MLVILSGQKSEDLKSLYIKLLINKQLLRKSFSNWAVTEKCREGVANLDPLADLRLVWIHF